MLAGCPDSICSIRLTAFQSYFTKDYVWNTKRAQVETTRGA